jgi:hypothetical protein
MQTRRGAEKFAPKWAEWLSEIRGGTARRDKKLTVPCRCFEILAGKCGFNGQLERRNDGSGAERNGNANPVLT